MVKKTLFILVSSGILTTSMVPTVSNASLPLETKIGTEFMLTEKLIESPPIQTNVFENNDIVSSVPDSVTESSTTSSETLVGGKETKASSEVSTWEEFKSALSNVNISTIIVTNNLVATSAGPTVDHVVAVDFQNHSLDIKGYSMNVSNKGNLTISNLQFSGTSGGYLATGAGAFSITGEVSSLPGNQAGIANIPAGSVTFSGINLTYDREKVTSAAVICKNFTISNKSKVTSEAIKFYTNSPAASGNSGIIINQESHVTTNSNKSSKSGQVWDLDRTSNFFVTGQSTLEMNGDISDTGDSGGLFIINGDKTTLNILEGSKFISHSGNSPAVLLQSDGGSFNVDDHSSLRLQSDGQANTLGATLRFRSKGNMTFNATNHSKIEIEKTAKNAPAIRMYGGNNKINISGASDFIVKNAGDGTPTDPGSNGSNQAIQYTGGGGNEFNLHDADSSVFIDAKNGAAIDADNDSMTVTAETDTFFIARGNTKSKTKGIYNAGLLTFNMTALKYFDFRNDSGGLVFESSANSKFSSFASDLSAWTKGTNLDGDPTFRWDMLDFSMSGKNYLKLDYTTNSIMQSQFGTMTNYSRISANNQEAIVDELRVPTNADKFIYAHASVPEAKGELRDAYTDEVMIKVGIFDETGTKIEEVSGLSIGTDLSVYGDNAKKGLFKLDAPNKDFLIQNHTLKVLEAWRGKSGDSWVHESPEDDLTKEQPKVYDVMPPEPAKLANDRTTLSPGTKELAGTGESDSNVHVYLNGNDTSIRSKVESDNSFVIQMPEKLKKDDVVQIFLEDNSGLAEVIKPPITNSSVGNIQPLQIMDYHDATFKPAIALLVTGSLELVSVPSIMDFGTQKISSQAQTYKPNFEGALVISDSRGTDKDYWQLTLKESEGLASSEHDLSGLMLYTNSEGSLSINGENTIVEKRKLNDDGEIIISNEWSSTYGLSLHVPVDKQLLGSYSGTLSWSLENVPENT